MSDFISDHCGKCNHEWCSNCSAKYCKNKILTESIMNASELHCCQCGNICETSLIVLLGVDKSQRKQEEKIVRQKPNYEATEIGEPVKEK